MAMNTMTVPQGHFRLQRYPLQKKGPLRAWDAADEYILSYLHEQALPLETSRVLILNDAFGALTVALSRYSPCMVSDSLVSQQALLKNLQGNDLHTDSVTLFDSLQPFNETFDLVIIRIPKNLAMLEDQLHRLRACCHGDTHILAAAMSKHIHTSTLKLFERIMGPTTTSLARKKARLVHSTFDSRLKPGASPYPGQYMLDASGDIYLNHANVFSREKLDMGSRFLLEHIPQSGEYRDIVDLACGNGVLGIAAARLNPQARVGFVDESYMAVESARLNAERLLGDISRCSFRVSDCLQGINGQSQDLILNNSPFHQHYVTGDFIAWQMFKESRQALKPGGELVVVANRHLGYHVKLKKLFGSCELVASNRKFVILKAVNPTIP